GMRVIIKKWVENIYQTEPSVLYKSIQECPDTEPFITDH
ncbi:unnamed protein product, partial [marine sediment metagenome]